MTCTSCVVLPWVVTIYSEKKVCYVPYVILLRDLRPRKECQVVVESVFTVVYTSSCPGKPKHYIYIKVGFMFGLKMNVSITNTINIHTFTICAGKQTGDNVSFVCIIKQ